jgi:hypothetical protein
MPWTDLAPDPPPEREQRQVEDYARRRAKPRFYADENFPSVAIKILRQLGADVLTVRDVRRHGHPDENHSVVELYGFFGATICSKRGSPRSGSNIGSSRSNADVSGGFAANAAFSVFP